MDRWKFLFVAAAALCLATGGSSRSQSGVPLGEGRNSPFVARSAEAPKCLGLAVAPTEVGVQIERVAAYVGSDSSGKYPRSSLVRIQVYPRAGTGEIEGGTIEVSSASAAFSSGAHSLLVSARGGVPVCGFWNTSGLKPAPDYRVRIWVNDAAGRAVADSSLVISIVEAPAQAPASAVIVPRTAVEMRTLGEVVKKSPAFKLPLEIDRVASYVWNDSDNVFMKNSVVRIQVYARALALGMGLPAARFQASSKSHRRLTKMMRRARLGRVVSGTVQVVSASQGYNSGVQNMVINPEGRGGVFAGYYWFWDAWRLNPAVDYRVTVSLTDTARQTAWDSSLVIAIESRLPLPTKTEAATDLALPARGLPLQVTRTYDCRTGYVGPFGYGWNFTYGRRLLELDDSLLVMVLTPELDEYYYTRNSDGSYRSRAYDHSRLTKNSDSSYSLREKYGTTYDFDSSGLLTAVTDRNNNQFNLTYNSRGLPTKVRDPAGRTMTLSYSSDWLVSSITDPAGRTWRYGYDGSGDLVSVTDPLNGQTQYSYDSNHNLTARTDALGKPFYFTYDGADRLTEVRNSVGSRLTYGYGASQMTATNALSEQVTLNCNPDGRVTSLVDPRSSTSYFTWDSAYNLTGFTDANGHSSSFEYDSLGNALEITNALGDRTELLYEPDFNQVTSVTDANGNQTSFSYDSRGNNTVVTYPDASAERYGYDQYGNKTSVTNRRSMTRNRTFNAQGQLLTDAFSGNTATFSYDAAGNQTSLRDRSGTLRFTHDALGRVTSEVPPGGKTVRTQYDAVGNRIRLTYPEGDYLVYTYDGGNRLVSIGGYFGQVVTYSYDNADRRIQKTLGNGAYSTYSYDAAGNLLELANRKSSGEVISRFAYTYDNVGNRLGMSAPGGQHSYDYDRTDQLTEVTYPGDSTYSYSLDPVGNRARVTGPGGMVPYSSNLLNQYTSAGNTTYSYDSDGNMESKTGSSGTITYKYEVGGPAGSGQLAKVTTPSLVTDYGYDLRGRRSSRKVSDTTTVYVSDGDRVISDYVNRSRVACYVYGVGIDEVLLMRRAGQDYYYHCDALGSVTDLTDSRQEVVESYEYSVYGEPSGTSSVGNRFMFSGREFDNETGLYYLRTRYYDPSIGRFGSADPLGLAPDANVYRYTGNEPVGRTDPSGLRFVPHRWAGPFGPNWIPVPPPGAIPGFFKPEDGDIQDERWESQRAPDKELVPDCPVVGKHGNTWVWRYPSGGGPWLHFPSWGGWVYGGGFCPTYIQRPRIGPTRSRAVWGEAQEANLVARVAIPESGSLLRSDIPIFGLAAGKHFRAYRAEYGNGPSPVRWELIDSSSLSQSTCEMDAASVQLLQGDVDVRGNLATWNTGLTEFEHLPWHPENDTIDLNGTYTIRLVVYGKDGDSVEDRVTCEVGRVIPQCLGGYAISTDKKVRMVFPEQSVTEAFRLFAIKPAESVPAIPTAHRQVGDVYEFREPGDKFTKDVSLEFEYSESDVAGLDLNGLGIYTYDWTRNLWQYLPTARKEGERKLVTPIHGLTAKRALYAVLSSQSPAERSIAWAAPAPNAQQKPVADSLGRLVWNTFEDGSGEWSNRDGEVGATVTRDSTTARRGRYSMKLTNSGRDGNFACNVCTTPFDAREFPIVEFDYRIPTDVKINFLAKVADRWYDIRFTDDPKDLKYKNVNITDIGAIEGVLPDDQWRHASFNLYDMLRTKTANYVVDELILADWNVSGFMKLDFGENRQGAALSVDNFTVRRDAKKAASPSFVVVDSFDRVEDVNSLGGTTGAFWDEMGKAVLRLSHERGKWGKAVRFSWDVTPSGSYTGYWSQLGKLDAREFGALTFWVKGVVGSSDFQVGLKDGRGNESKVSVRKYLARGIDNNWQKVAIPLTAFAKLTDWGDLANATFAFENLAGAGEGTAVIDQLQFERDVDLSRIDDFEAEDSFNLVGGRRFTFTHGAGAIGAERDTKHARPGSSACYRVSFGGNIGKDFGGGDFSYAAWNVQMRGVDASQYRNLIFYASGEKGGEKPNIYLTDGTMRECVDIEKYCPLTTAMQKVTVPLEDFARKGVDLTHLDELQFVFEWTEMSGTIFVDDIGLER
ncbi:hypothetical protein FJY68_10745 [candidate division WOR-3 bacterium]|uniref:Uncharacterized protein n=1 Tax=candidate division WOR-3 bacterium TaxID=2052148 RepID=A0A937XIG7_UNCW3|nr:hypothetical protein [candidate division WOR-3 bacterium]